MCVILSVQIALALMLLPKQRMTRRWSRPDVLMGLAILTSLTIILRLELAALLIPLAIQAWWYDRVDLLEGGFAVGFSALASLSKPSTAVSVVSELTMSCPPPLFRRE